MRGLFFILGVLALLLVAAMQIGMVSIGGEAPPPSTAVGTA